MSVGATFREFLGINPVKKSRNVQDMNVQVMNVSRAMWHDQYFDWFISVN